jgi:hypothetical protein
VPTAGQQPGQRKAHEALDGRGLHDRRIADRIDWEGKVPMRTSTSNGRRVDPRGRVEPSPKPGCEQGVGRSVNDLTKCAICNTFN